MIKQYAFSFTRTGKTMYLPCLITMPDTFSPESESLPLIVFLHGAGERSNDYSCIRRNGIPHYFANIPDYQNLRVITLSPICPPENIWNHFIPELAACIETIIDRYKIDRNRVSLTGISMGAFGAWDLACTRPDLFSALSPICGGGAEWRLNAIKHLPVRAFHGTDDTVVPPEHSILMIKALKKCGNKHADLTLFEHVGHNSWKRAYEETDLIAWLAASHR